MLRGSKAIVTGASRGIGLAIAKELAKEGCSVVITGRKEEALQAAAESVQGNVIPLVWDASDISQTKEKMDAAIAALGGLDILVNNAGLFSQAHEWTKERLLNTTVEEWEIVMKTNTDALFFAMQSAVNYMLKHKIKGNILNITSVAGYEPAYGAYGTSKTASNALTRGWGKMFAPDGIVINGIAPGPAATEMNHWHEGDSLENKGIPFGRFATVEELARLAKFLLSRDGEMLCGEIVVMDGAYAIR